GCDRSLWLGTATTAPYSLAYNTTTIANGSHAFTCKAYDTAEQATVSSANTSTVNNATTTPGQMQWAKTSVGTVSGAQVQAWGVAADHSGNVVSVGDFQGSADFGSGPVSSAGGLDAFIAKYSTAGALQWFKRLGGNQADDYARAVVTDSQGNIIVAGCFGGTVDFGGQTLTSIPDPWGRIAADIFVVKYSASGSLVWAKRFGGSNVDIGDALALDGNDNIFLAARLGSINADFGGLTLSSAGSYDIALAKLSPQGTVLWAKRWGGTDVDLAHGVAVDRAGDLVVSGEFWGTSDLGGGSRVSAGLSDIFIAKYSGADGSYRWGKMISGSYMEESDGVATDPNT